MALTPDNNAILLEELDVTETIIEPSKTWIIDFDNGHIGGFIDGDLANKQFIKKALMTERDRYVIYTENYGSELHTLIGQSLSSEYLNIEIPRIVSETIIYDDRFESVTTSFNRLGDQLDIDVTVTATQGETITEGVRLNGV